MSKVSYFLVFLLFVFFFEATSGKISLIANNEVENPPIGTSLALQKNRQFGLIPDKLDIHWFELAKNWFHKFDKIARGNDAQKLANLIQDGFFFVGCDGHYNKKQMVEMLIPPNEIKYHYFDLKSYYKTDDNVLAMNLLEHTFGYGKRAIHEYTLFLNLSNMKLDHGYPHNCGEIIDEDTPVLIVG